MAQYCSYCGTEIQETDKFCKVCGTRLSVKKIEATDNYGILFLIISAIVVVGFVAFYLLTPETRNIAVSIPYQEPVYEIRTVAATVPYQEAIYETHYSGTFKDTGLSTTSWTFKDATSYTYEYTGKDFWGSPEYTFKVCKGSQCTNYPEINTWDVSPKTEITGYTTKYKTEYKTENYLARYETKYRTEYKDVSKTRLEWFLGV